MALAIRFDQLIQDGVGSKYSVEQKASRKQSFQAMVIGRSQPN